MTLSAAVDTDARRLIVHVVYRFAVGGLENGVVNLINHMDRRCWRHAVVSLTDIDPTFARRLEPLDVRLISLHKPPGQGIWQVPKLWRLFRRLRPDIVHTRNLAALEAQLAAWLAGVPGRVHGEHGRDVEDVDGTSRRHMLMRRAYRPFTQRQIALGQDLASYTRDKVGVPADRLHSIYNGVDTTRFAPAVRRQALAGSPFNDPALWLIGTVGRMRTVKAQPLLAQAFVQAVQLQPTLRERVRLVLVGDGPLRASCEAILQAAGMADLAWLPGERADVPDVMRSLDCFALPSLAEGISNTILEAMASGLPVLATRVGANAELVQDGSTGLVVPPNDPAALANGIVRLAQDGAGAAAMGRKGRVVAERQFSLPVMVQAYQAVYEQLLPCNGRE
ncbi:MAG: sugar transferase [Leptothrix sp. (in: Bacteria)]|nr:sugar transferase [Leptothrix sp. (in: b-proteobacteria)]